MSYANSTHYVPIIVTVHNCPTECHTIVFGLRCHANVQQSCTCMCIYLSVTSTNDICKPLARREGGSSQWAQHTLNCSPNSWFQGPSILTPSPPSSLLLHRTTASHCLGGTCTSIEQRAYICTKSACLTGQLPYISCIGFVRLSLLLNQTLLALQHSLHVRAPTAPLLVCPTTDR